MFFFAFALSQWFIANRALRLGAGTGIFIFKKGFLDDIDSFIDPFSDFNIP
jgi:hypothetical protein